MGRARRGDPGRGSASGGGAKRGVGGERRRGQPRVLPGRVKLAFAPPQIRRKRRTCAPLSQVHPTRHPPHHRTGHRGEALGTTAGRRTARVWLHRPTDGERGDVELRAVFWWAWPRRRAARAAAGSRGGANARRPSRRRREGLAAPPEVGERGDVELQAGLVEKATAASRTRGGGKSRRGKRPATVPTATRGSGCTGPRSVSVAMPSFERDWWGWRRRWTGAAEGAGARGARTGPTPVSRAASNSRRDWWGWRRR